VLLCHNKRESGRVGICKVICDGEQSSGEWGVEIRCMIAREKGGVSAGTDLWQLLVEISE
jgi:hypothetical protein